MADTQVAKREEQAVRKAAVQTPEPEVIYVPDVDIGEDSESIRLLADMPGVDQKNVDVTVENNVLSIQGQAHMDAPKGYQLLGQEHGVGKYRREFSLSNAVGIEGIKARVRHGVLEVTIPKREEEQAKRKAITIEAD